MKEMTVPVVQLGEIDIFAFSLFAEVEGAPR